MRLLALATLVRQELGAALRQRGAALACMTIAAFCCLCVVAIALISLHRYLAGVYGPYWADAALALLFLLLAIIALLSAAAIEKRARRREHLRTTMLAVISTASQAMPDKSSALQSLLIAALAGGFWFGRKK